MEIEKKDFMLIDVKSFILYPPYWPFFLQPLSSKSI
nr:MAG TPA: hypothetical protein [Caudoviricetes sp.]